MYYIYSHKGSHKSCLVTGQEVLDALTKSLGEPRVLVETLDLATITYDTESGLYSYVGDDDVVWISPPRVLTDVGKVQEYLNFISSAESLSLDTETVGPVENNYKVNTEVEDLLNDLKSSFHPKGPSFEMKHVNLGIEKYSDGRSLKEQTDGLLGQQTKKGNLLDEESRDILINGDLEEYAKRNGMTFHKIPLLGPEKDWSSFSREELEEALKDLKPTEFTEKHGNRRTSVPKTTIVHGEIEELEKVEFSIRPKDKSKVLKYLSEKEGYSEEGLARGYDVFELESGILVIQRVDTSLMKGLIKFENDHEAGKQAQKDGLALYTVDHLDLMGWYIVDTEENRKRVDIFIERNPDLRKSDSF